MPINIDGVGQIQQHNIQDVISQGSISLGGKTYSVAVVNDRVQVQRQDVGQMSTGQRIANGIKDFFGRLFNEGALTTRASRLESSLQGMLQNVASQTVAEFRNDLQISQGYLEDHTPQNFTESCVQTMSDDPGVQQMLRQNLDNPLYSRERFTGIEPHPTDSSKFIAVFGENRLEFSDRQSSNLELRGAGLKEQLAQGNYQNLGDLIGQNYLTSKDSILLYSFNPAVMNLMHKIQDWPQAMKDQVIVAISNQPIGNTTIGEAFGDKLRAPV